MIQKYENSKRSTYYRKYDKVEGINKEIFEKFKYT